VLFIKNVLFICCRHLVIFEHIELYSDLFSVNFASRYAYIFRILLCILLYLLYDLNNNNYNNYSFTAHCVPVDVEYDIMSWQYDTSMFVIIAKCTYVKRYQLVCYLFIVKLLVTWHFVIVSIAVVLVLNFRCC